MWTIASCFVAAIASALLPWVNAELMLLAVTAPLTSFHAVSGVVLAVTAGQVLGKCGLYWVARHTSRSTLNGRFGKVVERWQVACGSRHRSTQTMMTLSAVFGLPPFYVTTVAAGALRVDFGRFLAAAVFGRLVHFSAVGLTPMFIHAAYH